MQPIILERIVHKVYNGYRIIAVCISKIFDERKYSFIKALSDHAGKAGYRLFIYHTCSDLYWQTKAEKGETAVFQLIDYDITDIVVTFEEGFFDAETLENIRTEAAAHGKPVVCIGAEHEGCINVTFDFKTGFEQVVRHVVESHGIKDVCLIAGLKGEKDSEERIGVYTKVLRENGIPFDEDRLYYGDYWSAPTIKAVRKMIGKNDVPRAVICANDMMAITAGAELQKQGYRIPEDVIITGFDGSVEAKYCTPMLTTCECSYDNMSEMLIKLFEDILAGKTVEKDISVNYSLDISQSCGCIAEAIQINTGEHIRKLRDRFNRYQDEERVLYETSSEFMTCDSPEECSRILGDFDFDRTAVVINKECLDDTVNPVGNRREKAFDDEMCLLFCTESDINDLPKDFNKRSVIPWLDKALEAGDPLVISALCFTDIPQGYVCFYFPIRMEEYGKIPLYVNFLNTSIGSYRNVKYQKYMARHIEDIYKLDALTELYNRNGFYNALEKLERGETKYALVVSADVDGLKYINDHYGHEAGDYAIRAAAEAVNSVKLENKICGRFGGDELALFAYVNSDCGEQVKAQIAEYLSELNRKSGKPFALSASVGAAVSSADTDFDEIMKLSDKRMYEEKSRKPNRRRD